MLGLQLCMAIFGGGLDAEEVDILLCHVTWVVAHVIVSITMTTNVALLSPFSSARA